jgi:hypothetical protein
MRIKNRLFRYLGIGTFTVILTIMLLLVPFVHNNIAKFLLSHYLSSKKIKFSSSDLVISIDKIKIKNAELKYDNDKIFSPEVIIDLDLKKLLKKRKSDIKLISKDITLNENLKFETSIDAHVNTRREIVKIFPVIKTILVPKNDSNINEINITGGFHLDVNNIEIESVIVNFSDGKIETNAKISKNVNGIKDIQADVDIKNTSLLLYKILLSKEDRLYQFFDESIKSGDIKSANFTVNLSEDFIRIARSGNLEKFAENFTNKNAKGEFIFSNVEYKYDSYMPTIKAAILPAQIDGKIARIKLHGATVASNVVTDGRVKFDYLAKNIEIIVDAKSEGDPSGLVKFIDPSTLKSLKFSNVDLEKVNGHASTDIKIRIPMQKGSENIYDINSTITNTNIDILNNRLKISDYTLKGKFDGHKISILGNGKINKFDSKTKLDVNLDTSDEFSHKIDTEIYLTKSDEENSGLKFLDGKSVLKISMISKDDTTNLKASSNLINSHFVIPSLAIEKQIGKKARFDLEGKLIEGAKQSFSLKLVGEDDLKIIASIHTDNDSNKINLREVKYKNNNFSALLTTTKNSIFAHVEGKMLDLSQADLGKFMNNNSNSSGKSKINIMLDQIKMKNGVNFTDAMFILDCINEKCPVARLSTEIDNKDYLQIDYIDDKNKPKWKLESNEAGKVFAALGITNKVKNGRIKLVMDAPLTNPKIPGYKSNGFIEIYDVDSTKNKFLTKMVSFISIPGLLGAITNQDIRFDKVKSEIYIEDRVIGMRKTTAEGPYFYFHSKGSINLNSRKIDIKGQVVPSVYGINKLAGSLPVIKYLFGNRGGIVFTPFYYEDSF